MKSLLDIKSSLKDKDLKNNINKSQINNLIRFTFVAYTS